MSSMWIGRGYAIAVTATVLCLGSARIADAQLTMSVRNRMGMRLVVAPQHADPALRIILPGRPVSDTSINILFPEHVTAVERGSTAATQLYMFRPGRAAEPPTWRSTANYVEYERELAPSLHFRARATLEDDGIRFRYEFANRSSVAYAMIYAVTDPRLTGAFHDPRLERTYVHHADGFDLLASETPARLQMPIQEWLPARYLASLTWPVPTELTARRDGIMYYNKSRRVDESFIATTSTDRAWVVASSARESGNVWSNPALTCQHVDPQITLDAGATGVIEVKLLVLQGSVEDAFRRAREQRAQLTER
jgi:hypothetical protein